MGVVGHSAGPGLDPQRPRTWVAALALAVVYVLAVATWSPVGERESAVPAGPGDNSATFAGAVCDCDARAGAVLRNETGPETGTAPGTAVSASLPVGAAVVGCPMLAIVIDDLGWGSAGTADVLSLPADVTVAVIPGGPHSVSEAEQARMAGHEVLLHLPMEPIDPSGRGIAMAPGTITTSMAADEIRRLVNKYLDEVGPVPGLNNHTGSRAAADLRVVEAIVDVARERGVFIIDSRTIRNSLLEVVARRDGVPAAANMVFLDNNKDESYIRLRILEAAALAKKRGAAIAIGHVHPLTAKAIREALPEIERLGVVLAPASAVVRSHSVPASGMGDPRLR